MLGSSRLVVAAAGTSDGTIKAVDSGMVLALNVPLFSDCTRMSLFGVRHSVDLARPICDWAAVEFTAVGSPFGAECSNQDPWSGQRNRHRYA